MTMKLIFLRHGQDDDTRRGGWSQFGLLEEGHVQAQKTAAYLRSAAYQIGAVYASDLPRAMETAQYCCAALELPMKLEPAVREMNNGDLAGMPNEEALVKYPGLFFSSLGMEEAYPGGESPREFFDRIRGWFWEFLYKNRNDQEDILVVTHGGVIKIIYHLVEQMAWTNRSDLVSAGKCSIHVLDVDTMTFEVNDLIVW